MTIRTPLGSLDSPRQNLAVAFRLLGALLLSLWMFGCVSNVESTDSPNVAAVSQSVTTAVYQINCGGPAADPFTADQFVSGGNTYRSSATITTAGVANAAPQAVYQAERWGDHSYTLGSLTPNGSYLVRLHFAEISFSKPGVRVFNVAINGTQVLTNLDIVATVGPNKALVYDFPATASSSGQIVVHYSNVVEYAKSSGIELFANGSTAPTSVTVNPGSAQLALNGTQQFQATARDENGDPLASQPTFSWSATGGTINSAGLFTASAAGAFTVSATTAGKTGSATVQVGAASGSAIYAINSGGGATGSFSADGFVSGGNTYRSSATITTAGVTNAAPQAVYQAERWGDHSYTLGSLTPNGSYLVRLHFAEISFSKPGARVFNVAINGTQVLTNLDIVATVGPNKALVYDFPATASSSGQVVVHYSNVVEYAKSSGIELFASGSTAPPPTLTSVTVNPGSAQLTVNGTQQFQAMARDQNGSPLANQPAFSWAVSGGGSINATGLFTASASGTFTVSATTSSKTGTATVSVSTGGPASGDMVVNVNDVRQRIDGFGASDKYATLSDDQADLLFSTTNGIGLSSLRVAISTEGTDISPYSNAQKAAARGAIVWGAPWSPPAQWKDNGSTGNGGHLLPEYYDAWATRLAGFATTMQQNGVTLYGLSPQNEPEYTATWDSCLYSPAQLIAFIKVLGPKLSALNPKPKLIAPEVGDWGLLWSYADPILQDATANSFTDIIGTHDYSYGTPTHAPISKPIWQTEVATFDGPTRDIGNGIMVAKWIHRAIVVGSVSAWHYWWLIGDGGSSNQGLIDPGKPSNKRLYTLGNFSKFVRPGQQLVGVTGPIPGNTSVSAYLNPVNQALVIVIINENSASTPVSFYVPGSHASATPSVTSASDDLAVKAAISVIGGRFSTTLAAQSVTTFVVP